MQSFFEKQYIYTQTIYCTPLTWWHFSQKFNFNLNTAKISHFAMAVICSHVAFFRHIILHVVRIYVSTSVYRQLSLHSFIVFHFFCGIYLWYTIYQGSHTKYIKARRSGWKKQTKYFFQFETCFTKPKLNLLLSSKRVICVGTLDRLTINKNDKCLINISLHVRSQSLRATNCLWI